MSKRLRVKYSLFLSDFNEILIFSTDFSKKSQMQSFIKIHPVGAELFYADKRTDRRADRTKQIRSRFSQFANATKNRGLL
jgi:hypothetical protein